MVQGPELDAVAKATMKEFHCHSPYIEKESVIKKKACKYQAYAKG